MKYAYNLDYYVNNTRYFFKWFETPKTYLPSINYR